MMREVELDPYVQSCLEIFGGEIVRIDPPRPIASETGLPTRPVETQEADV
jgi:hypothetical protein